MSDKDEEGREKSFWQQLKYLAKFRAVPDSTQKLEHEIQELLEDGEVDDFMINKTTGIDEDKIAALSEGIPVTSRQKAEALRDRIVKRIAEIVAEHLDDAWHTAIRQCFQFGPRDTQDISWDLAKDANATIAVISGAWAVPLFKSNRNFAEIRAEGDELVCDIVEEKEGVH